MGLTAQDHEDIRQLVARYNQGIDLGDHDQFVSTFTEDGSFQVLGLADDVPVDGRHQGHEALRALAAVHYGNFKGRARHWATNLLIEGDGDEATMQCYLNGFRAGQGDSAMLASTGIYRDKLRRTADGWRFLERVVTMDPE